MGEEFENISDGNQMEPTHKIVLAACRNSLHCWEPKPAISINVGWPKMVLARIPQLDIRSVGDQVADSCSLQAVTSKQVNFRSDHGLFRMHRRDACCAE